MMVSSRVSTGFEVMDKDLGTRAEIHAVVAERIEERKISEEKRRRKMKGGGFQEHTLPI